MPKRRLLAPLTAGLGLAIALTDCQDEEASSLSPEDPLVEVPRTVTAPTTSVAPPTRRRSTHWFEKKVGDTAHGVVRDPRFEEWKNRHVPDVSIDVGMSASKKPQLFSKALTTVLSGIPGEVGRAPKGAVVLEGCRAGSCDEKGHVWFNPRTGSAVVSLGVFFFQGKRTQRPTLLIGTKGSCKNLPPAAGLEVRSWVERSYSGQNPNFMCISEQETASSLDW